MSKSLAAATAALGLLIAGPALAADAAAKAEVASIKGAVLVSQDGKFAPAAQKSALRAGDRVVARDGQATIRYADGCAVTLKTGAMATVGEASPCAGGAGLIRAGDASAQSRLGRTGAAVAVIGSTLLTVWLLTELQDDNDGPVSP
jgi:hypothetical protein